MIPDESLIADSSKVIVKPSCRKFLGKVVEFINDQRIVLHAFVIEHASGKIKDSARPADADFFLLAHFGGQLLFLAGL
jgi:hypothetical protein